MKKDFNDAIMKLEDFCKTYNALSMEDKLLFAVLGPNGSDVAATVANEINEPKDPKGGLTEEEFSRASHYGDNDRDPDFCGQGLVFIKSCDVMSSKLNAEEQLEAVNHPECFIVAMRIIAPGTVITKRWKYMGDNIFKVQIEFKPGHKSTHFEYWG